MTNTSRLPTASAGNAGQETAGNTTATKLGSDDKEKSTSQDDRSCSTETQKLSARATYAAAAPPPACSKDDDNRSEGTHRRNKKEDFAGIGGRFGIHRMADERTSVSISSTSSAATGHRCDVLSHHTPNEQYASTGRYTRTETEREEDRRAFGGQFDDSVPDRIAQELSDGDSDWEEL